MIFENHGRQALPERLESGVVQVDGDWPGLFIRGDDCMAINQALHNLMIWLDKHADETLRTIAVSVGTVGELLMALDLVIEHAVEIEMGL